LSRFNFVMKVYIHEFLESIHHLKGSLVIIDVFRAFSTSAWLLANGAEKILSVSQLEHAYLLHEKNPETLLMGERDGFIQPGFHYGNSPESIRDKDFTGKTIIHTSSSGTQGLVLASKYADEVLPGNLLNARAICQYLKQAGRKEIHLIAMGFPEPSRGEEDYWCAQYMYDLLTKDNVCYKPFEMKIRYAYRDREKDFVQSGRWNPGDMDLCLQADRFNFVIKAEIHDEHCVEIRKIKEGL